MKQRISIIASVLFVNSLLASTYYVNASRPDDSGNGLGWNTAKKTIQAAVDVSTGGDSIIVTNGVYAQISTANKVITIQSVNGAGLTIIDGANSQRCATLGAADGETNSVLIGLTLRNGRVDMASAKGGGVIFGTLYSCVISNNISTHQPAYLGTHEKGYAYGGGAYGSTLTHCYVVKNQTYVFTGGATAISYGGGTYGGNLNNCVVLENQAFAKNQTFDGTGGNPQTRGGGSFNGALKNCTVSKNMLLTEYDANYGLGIKEGFGVYGASLVNCVVWGNNGENHNGAVFVNSCSSPLPSGTGNTSADPFFIDFVNNNFRLQSISPCINAGTNDFVIGTVDLAGNPRIIDSHVDMGAYETLGPYAVSFDAQGGIPSVPSSIMVTNAITYGPLARTTKAGYIFGGWYTNATCTGTAITAATIVTLTSAHTLYAQWTLDTYYVAGGANVTPIGITSAVNSDTVHSGDGLNSIKLGGIGLLADGQMAGIEWSATGPGILSFEWKVSSEADYDWLRFYEAGSGPTNQISGTVDWNRMSVTVTGATDLSHTFRWEYAKDPAGEFVGSDCGWVDTISWTPLYTVAVNNGAGDGYYTNNAYVSITADTATVHYEFDRWTGDTNTVENVFSASTTLRMPNTNAIVTATYKLILYTLSTSNASGGGTYPYATSVEIRASAFENKRFLCWTGDVTSVANVNAATTTVVTSDHTLSLTATYSVPLTVNSGTGSGWYPEGSTANVSADADQMWKEFATWTGDAGLLSNANVQATTLTLSTGPATVTATYKDSIARLTGSYGRTYTESGTAGAITIDAVAGSPSGTPSVKLGGAGVIPDNGFSAFETVVNGSGSILFQWKVSSESNGDYLKFKVDGSEVAAISGTKGSWTQVSNRVDTAGSHTLRWEYVKNGSIASSTDAGWVDDIVWIGGAQTPVLTPVFVHACLTNQNMEIQFTGERGITYSIQTNGTLDHSGWSDYQTLQPIWINESNGVHRFEIVPPASVPDKLFYRISTPQSIFMVIDLSAGSTAESYPVSYILDVPVGGWTDEYKTTKLVLRKINKGSFTMGSPTDELGREIDEIQHEVTLTKDFYMGVFEVTQRQWELVMGNNPSYFNNVTYCSTRPVEQVSYYDIRENPSNNSISPNWPASSQVHADSFMGKLRIKTGLSTFDLPTESQWEYASRAGTTTALNLGYNLTSVASDPHMAEVGRYYHNGGSDNSQDGTSSTGSNKVGSYLPNAYGLYDMHGNVWEWCLDWYGAYTFDVNDPLGAGSGSVRGLRGGCLSGNAWECRSAFRGSYSPNHPSFNFGFRLSSTLP